MATDETPEEVSKEKPKKEKKVKKEKIKKSKKPKKPTSFQRYEEPKKMMINAIGGSFLAVLSLVFFNYIFWGFSDENLINKAVMLDNLSLGNPFNAVMGIWALSFTPFTALAVLAPAWFTEWYWFMIPLIVAGLIMAISTKRIGYTLISGVFFIFWAIVLPLIFVLVLPLFGVGDPIVVDLALTGILDDAISNWTPLHYWINSIFNNVFLTWCFFGAIELGLFVILVALPFALLFHGIKAVKK